MYPFPPEKNLNLRYKNGGGFCLFPRLKKKKKPLKPDRKRLFGKYSRRSGGESRRRKRIERGRRGKAVKAR